MSDDAYDLSSPLRTARQKCNPLPDRIFIRKILAGQRLIDDDDRRAVRGIVLGEKTTPLKRDSHGLEIVIRNTPLVAMRIELAGRYLPSFDLKAGAVMVITQRQVGYCSCGFNTGKLADIPESFAGKRTNMLLFGVFETWKGYMKNEQIGRIKSGIDTLDSSKTLHHQASTGKQHERDGHLLNDKRTLETESYPRLSHSVDLLLL